MEKPEPTLTRRTALVRLGLMATAAYSAPLVTRLDSARAAFPSDCGGGPGVGGGGNGGGGQGGGGGCGGGTANNPGNNAGGKNK